MIFLNYNNYGVLQNSDKSDVITKNSYRANSVFVAFSSLITNIATATSNYTCYATFVRNDDESINDLVMSPSTYTYGGTTYVGYFLLFTSKQITAVAGQLDLSIRLIRNSDNAEVVSASEPLVVADNGTTSDTTTSISTAQYEALTQVISNLNQPITILSSTYDNYGHSSIASYLSDSVGLFVKHNLKGFYIVSDTKMFYFGENGSGFYSKVDGSFTKTSYGIESIGMLTDLLTTDKSNLVNALNETYQLYVNFNTNVDDRINGKANITYVDTELAKKADKSDTYTKSETYSKNEVDASLLLKADTSDLNNVEALIPNDATTSNQLASKDFVNSSIATNTATFRGTFTSLDLLKQATGDANDYAILRVEDGQGNVRYDRFKWVEEETDNTHWVFEYTLNNSSFTEEQYQALNSGITANKLAQILTDLEAVYTKAESDTLFYTKTYIDSLIANYSTTSVIANTYCTKEIVNKSLYNLGAYDSVSTSNGITTITRQTGYVDLGDLNYYVYNDAQHGYFDSDSLVSVCVKPSENNEIGDLTTAIYSTKTANAVYLHSENKIIALNKVGRIMIYDNSFTNDDSGLASFKNAMKGVMLQYKLTTSYTEQVIENQPLNTLDQAQSQIVREDVENGRNILNLANVTSYSSNGVSTTYTNENGFVLNGTPTNSNGALFIKEILPLLENGTYSCSTFTNVSNAYVEFTIVRGGTTEWKRDTFTIDSSVSSVLLAIKNTNTNAISNGSVKVMLVKGSNPPTTFTPYNANKHITNEQAELLKNEFDRCSNLTSLNLTTFPLDSVSRHLLAENLPKGTYTLSLNLNNYANSSQLILYVNDNPIGTFFNGSSVTFTSNEDITTLKMYNNDAIATSSNVMLNEGSTALPYQEYEGKIVHKNELVKLYAHDVRLRLSIVYNNFDFRDADTSFTYRVITRSATPFANSQALTIRASDGEILSISLKETENESVIKAYPLSISLDDSDAGSWIVCMIDDTAKALNIDKNFIFVSDTVTAI